MRFFLQFGAGICRLSAIAGMIYASINSSDGAQIAIGVIISLAGEVIASLCLYAKDNRIIKEIAHDQRSAANEAGKHYFRWLATIKEPAISIEEERQTPIPNTKIAIKKPLFKLPSH